MSHKFAILAGFLVVAAAATPYLGSVVTPVGRADAASARVIESPVAAPAIVARSSPPLAATTPAVDPVPAYMAPAADAPVYGDPKQPDFDPERPPADMGEPG